MSDDLSGGSLDVATLRVLGERAATHPLVDGWAFQPDAVTPRLLEVRLDDGQYPVAVTAARLDVRWFEGDDYTVHYVEFRGDDVWQCRWDRHPKPGAPTAHFHPPPDASADVGESGVTATYHLGVLFEVLDWTEERLQELHGN